jgi:primase-polymerase (primpol)-like protein
MARRRQWVRYTGKKVPLAVGRGRATVASSTDPKSWCSYLTADRSTAGAGLGFVLTATDGIVCIDLDHALHNGQPLPWAQAILDQLPDTYIEVSPSRAGLHVWGYGEVGRGRRLRCGKGSIEVYDRGRYITVTREPFRGAPSKLADLTAAVDSLLRR